MDGEVDKDAAGVLDGVDGIGSADKVSDEGASVDCGWFAVDVTVSGSAVASSLEALFLGLPLVEACRFGGMLSGMRGIPFCL